MSEEGQIINIEGIDGSGKSTVFRKLDEDNDVNAFFTNEPEEGAWTEKPVRKAIRKEDTPRLTTFFLFLADHANHVENTITPHYNNGETIICDRYIDSRLAYQSASLDNIIEDDTLEWIRTTQKWSLLPDHTILLDLNVDIAIERLGTRKSKEVFEKKEFLKEVKNNYKELARKTDRYHIVNAEEEPEQVYNNVKNIILDVMD